MDEDHKFVIGTRVKTPVGSGRIIGFLVLKKFEFVVSLDKKPFVVSESGEYPTNIDSFEPNNLEVLKDEK